MNGCIQGASTTNTKHHKELSKKKKELTNHSIHIVDNYQKKQQQLKRTAAYKHKTERRANWA
jgi:hypothetical protein